MEYVRCNRWYVICVYADEIICIIYLYDCNMRVSLIICDYKFTMYMHYMWYEMQIHYFLPLLVSLKVFTRAVLILQAKDVSKTEYELVAAWDAGRSPSGETLIVHKGPRAAGQGVFWKPTERFANRKSVKFCEWILIWISEQKQIFTSWRAAGDLLSDLTLWPTLANSQSFWW